jgi:hypothetical protein
LKVAFLYDKIVFVKIPNTQQIAISDERPKAIEVLIGNWHPIPRNLFRKPKPIIFNFNIQIKEVLRKRPVPIGTGRIKKGFNRTVLAEKQMLPINGAGLPVPINRSPLDAFNAFSKIVPIGLEHTAHFLLRAYATSE